MRLIARFAQQSVAARAGHRLDTQGIPHVVEADDETGWALWVVSEDDFPRAREVLNKFAVEPNPISTPHQTATSPRDPSTRPAPAKLNRRVDPSHAAVPGGPPWLTLTLVAVCLLVALQSGLGMRGPLVQSLLISEVPFRLGAPWERFLPEVRAGQFWRLYSPALLHFGIPHLLFNLYALWDLGHRVESRAGPGRMLGLVFGLAVLSNLGQYLAHGPRFGGMSGAIYGLLGYAWMMGRYRPEAGIAIHPQAVFLMLVWFFICLSDSLGVPVANTAHAVGLVAGMIWGRCEAARHP